MTLPSKAPPELAPIDPLVRQAQRFQVALPDLAFLSLPLPVPGPDGLLWVFVLAPRAVVEAPPSEEPRAASVRLGRPAYRLAFRADFGVFHELAPLSTRDLGLPEQPEEGTSAWLGELGDLPEREARRPHLSELYRALAPSFAAGSAARTPALKGPASELVAFFPTVAEPPLLAVYRALAPRFFVWLGEVSA